MEGHKRSRSWLALSYSRWIFLLDHIGGKKTKLRAKADRGVQATNKKIYFTDINLVKNKF